MTHMPQSLNHDPILIHFMSHDYIGSLGCIPNEPKNPGNIMEKSSLMGFCHYGKVGTLHLLQLW